MAYWPDTGTGVDTQPARKPVQSPIRKYFTEGGIGQAPTVPGGDWFNQMTNEVLNVLEAAGIEPSKADDDQLLLAIKKISRQSSAYKNWKADLSERGIILVNGSFEEGAETTAPNQAVMHYLTGTPYILKSGSNAEVTAGESPNSDWIPVVLMKPLPIVSNSKIAHRCLTPENTILALGSCKRLGFDAVETDAKQSSDGVWYIFHDDYVDNLTSGTGLFSSLASSYIDTLRFDSLSGGKFYDEPIPLVSNFLKQALISGLTVYLEIKSYLSYAEIASLVNLVNGLNAGSNVILCSMDMSVLRHIRFELGSDVPLQYVYEGLDYITAINSVVSLQRCSISYFNNYVRQYPQVVSACVNAGISLFAWTILNRKTADQCVRIGATNIVTDILL